VVGAARGDREVVANQLAAGLAAAIEDAIVRFGERAVSNAYARVTAPEIVKERIEAEVESRKKSPGINPIEDPKMETPKSEQIAHAFKALKMEADAIRRCGGNDSLTCSTADDIAVL